MNIKSIHQWYTSQNLSNRWICSVNKSKIKGEHSLENIYKLSLAHPDKTFHLSNVDQPKWIELSKSNANPVSADKNESNSIESKKVDPQPSSNVKVKKSLSSRTSNTKPTPSNRKVRSKKNPPKKSTPWLTIALGVGLLVGGFLAYTMFMSKKNSIAFNEPEKNVPSPPQIPKAIENEPAKTLKATNVVATIIKNHEAPPTSFSLRSLASSNLPAGKDLFESWTPKKSGWFNILEDQEFATVANGTSITRKGILYQTQRSANGKKSFFIQNKASSITLPKDQVGLMTFWANHESTSSLMLKIDLKQVDTKRGKSEFPISKYINLPPNQWTEVNIPFKTRTSSDTSETSLSIYTEDDFQELSLADIHVWLMDGHRIDNMPLSHITTYKGREKQSSWRNAANERIEKYRKRDIQVKISMGGKALENKEFKLTQVRHHFQHGSALNYKLITGTDQKSEQYRTLAKQLFNSASAENAQKWRIMTMGKKVRLKKKSKP